VFDVPATLNKFDGKPIEQFRVGGRFALPAEIHELTRVLTVYPTATALPENLLRLYVTFSAPMNRGEAWQNLRLLRIADDGSETAVEAPFVEIEQELWDASQQRLTILFDPGRIKRGLRPHDEAGPPLTTGGVYRLIVASEWLDAHNQPLALSHEKMLRVGAADRESPNPEDWQLTPPNAGDHDPKNRDAVVLAFPESLDRGLLMRLVRVVDSAGERLDGMPETGDGETTWRFVPEAPWTAGDYAIEVDTLLEDLAGNSLRRLFDMPIGEPAAMPAPQVPDKITLSFVVD
jgi:hypothetical protein